MSGADSDGVIGLKHIRAHGGVTIAQDPNEAEYDSMPGSAIASGMVDWVLPVEKMAPKLMEFVQNENRMKLPPEIPEADAPDAKVEDAPGGETVSEETRDREDETAMGEVLADVRAKTGHDFDHYKRATVLRRIARRMQVNSLESIPQYLEFIRTHPAEGRASPPGFAHQRDAFLSRSRSICGARSANSTTLRGEEGTDDEMRVWVAGCATGEEAYSIAMLLHEHAERHKTAKGPNFRHGHRRAGDRGSARRTLPVNDRGGRVAGTVASVLCARPRPLPRAQTNPREGSFRCTQCVEGFAVLAVRSYFLSQPSHLPDSAGAGAGIRSFSFRIVFGRPPFHRQLGE